MKMLLHSFPVSSEHQTTSVDANAAHILCWLKILRQDPLSSTRQLPTTIATPQTHLCSLPWWPAKSTMVKIIHSFATIVIHDEHHCTNGCTGFFIGNCIAAPMDHGWHLQNPPLGTRSSPAEECTISESNNVFLPASMNGKHHHQAVPHPALVVADLSSGTAYGA